MLSITNAPSPIREQTAFMAALTALRTEYEANMAALYASQSDYKAAFSLVETLKDFAYGDLDHLKVTVSHGMSVMFFVLVTGKEVEALVKALTIAGLTYTTSISPSGRRAHISVTGYPNLRFMAPAESINLELEVACA